MVRGYLYMKPETWLSASIVSQYDSFEHCGPYEEGKLWYCFYKIMPGIENALYIQLSENVSKKVDKDVWLVDLE
jgi:hypothetical protein